MSDINPNSQRNLLTSPLLKNIHLCRDMPSQSVIFNILESVLYQQIKHRLGIFKRVWKMSQSVDFHLSLCNLCNLWICVLLPPELMNTSYNIVNLTCFCLQVSTFQPMPIVLEIFLDWRCRDSNCKIILLFLASESIIFGFPQKESLLRS